jgi:hypothetical protein
VLDARTVRFFSRRSFDTMLRSQALVVRRREALGGSRHDGAAGLGLAVRPTLFARHFVYEVAPGP